MTEGECSRGQEAAYILNCGIDGNEWLDLRLFLLLCRKEIP